MEHFISLTKIYLLLIYFLSAITTYTTVQSHIQTKSPTLDFSNAGYLSKLGFPFKLSTPLLSTEYIKLTFPFPLHSTTTATHPKYTQLNPPSNSNLVIAKDVTVTWDTGEVDNGCAKTTDQELGSVFTWGTGSKEYFIQFFDSNLLSIQVENDIWYTLWINFTDPTVLSNQQSKAVLSIAMETVSSAEQYPQIYDENPAFAFFMLETAPKSSLNVTAFFNNAENTYTEEGNHELEENNCIIIDIYAQVGISDGAKIIYKMTDNAFTFINNCTSEEKLTVPTISKLKSNFTCTIDTAMNALVVELTQPLEQYGRLRIQTYAKNPNFLTKSAIEVRTMKQYIPVIQEQGTSSSGFLYTNPIELSSHNLNLAWNLNLDRSVADLPIQLKVIRGDAQTPNYCPYNSFRVNFQPKITTPSGVMLKLIMKVQANSVNGEEPDILSGSLSENLPKLTTNSEEVKCKIYNRTNGDYRKIICTNIGQLLSTQQYHIGFKMYFPYDIGTEEIDLEYFGTLELFSYNSYLLDYNSEALIKLSRPNNAQTIPTKNSMNWQCADSGNEENIIISTQSGVSYTIAERGIHLSSSPQRFFLNLNAAYSELTNQTTLTGTGLRILMNPLFTGTSTLTPARETTGSGFAVTATFETQTAISESSYSLLQFSSTSDMTLKEAFPSTRAEKQISFDSVSVNSVGSMFVDDNSFDFYIVGYDQINADVSQATAGNYVLVNGYCMTPFNNLETTISNFWTSDANPLEETLSGNYIPLILRISGKLLTSESTDVTSFAIFFDNLDFFSLNDLADEKSIIDANSSRNNNINKKINIYIAAMKDHTSYSGKTYKMITMMYKQTKYDLTASASTISLPLLNAATSPDYGLDVDTGNSSGVVSSITLKAGHTGGAVGTGGSAGFTYVLSLAESLLEWNSAQPTFTGSCLGFKYFYIDSSDSANNEYKYGIFCSLSSGAISSATAIQLYNLKVPYETGRNLLGYGGYSKSDGSLYTLQKESHLIASSNSFTFNSITPSSLVKGVKNYRFIIDITTSNNNIQEGAVIQLHFMTSVNFISNEDSKCMIKLKTANEFLDLVCTISTPSSTQIRYKLTGITGKLVPENYLIYHYGVDNMESNGQNTSVIVEIISREDDDAYFISDRSSSGKMFYYINDETQIAEQTPKITLDVTAETNNKKATSILDLQIQVFNTYIYHNQQLLINLGQVASDNQNNYNLRCQVLNSSKQLSNNWKLLNQASLDRIKLQLKQDLEAENTTLYLRCLHTILPFTSISTTNIEKAKTLTASLILPSSERVLYSSDSIEFLPSNNDTSLGGGNLLLQQKLGNTYGSINSLTFSLQIPKDQCVLNCSSQLFITFPYYYPPGISSTGDVFCNINGMSVKCEVIRSRVLRINNLVNINSSSQDFEVNVFGGIMGEISSTQSLSSFWVGLVEDYSTGESNFCSQGIISDSSADGSQSSVAFLPIQRVSTTSSYIREDRGITFWLYLENSIETEEVLVVRLAGLKEGGIEKEIACQVKQEEEDVVGECAIQEDGSVRIELVRGIDAEQWLEVVISGWRVRDSAVCVDGNEIVNVEIISEDNGRVVASSYGVVNTQGQIISRNNEKRQLGVKWSESGVYVDEINLIRGIYSPVMSVYPVQDGGYFGNQVQLQTIDANFSVLPDSVELVLGKEGGLFQIAMKQEMEINSYLFGMKFVNDKNYYENVELIKVTLDNTQKLIQLVEQSQFDIPLNSTETYIQLKLKDDELPESNIMIQFVLDKYTSGINIYPKKFQFNASLTTCQIQVKCDIDLAKVNNTNYISFILSGDNAASYSLAITKIKLTVIEALTNPPVLTAKNSQLSTIFDVYEIEAECDQPGVLYYQLLVDGYNCHEFNQTQIINEVDQNYELDSNTTCQQQFVRQILHKPNTTQQIKLSPILANLKYKLRGFCVNSNNQYGELQELSFSSDNNQGQVVKVKVELDVSEIKLVELDEVRMCCYFANYLNVPVESIQSPFNTYCYNDDYNYRRQLLEYHDIFNSTNSSYGNTVTTNQNLTFLFHPITTRLKDTSYLTIQSLTTVIMSEIQKNILGIPAIFKVYSPVEINQLIEVKEPEMEIVGGEEWIALLGIKGEQDGYIYACLFQNNQTNATFGNIPGYFYLHFITLNIAFEIKQGRSYQYGYPLAIAKYHYETTSIETITHNFTDLTVNTSYELFVVATREDLSLWPTFSNVLQYQLKTNITMNCALLVFNLGMVIVGFFVAGFVY